MMNIEVADRLKQLPPYLFKELDQKKTAARQKGVDIIDLGVGDPDLPTPPHIIAALQKAAEKPAYHRYPSYSGMSDFREAVARWYQKRFAVSLDPTSEVLTLIGSKEGIAHVPLAFIDPGDLALMTNPGYPVYDVAVKFAGGQTHHLNLRPENGYLPDLDAIPADICRKARLLFINYPNNPTAAVATPEFFARVVEFARAHQIIVCHDAAYTELAFDGYKPLSFMQTPGAREVGIEFHSLSKTYNMTGWRLGFAVGRAEVIQALGQIKSNIDSGAFEAIQIAGVAALDGDQKCVDEINREYSARRNILLTGLKQLGIEVEPPKATFYVWARVPGGLTSKSFCSLLLEQTGIVATPGVGFGAAGEGFFRMALTVSQPRLHEAIERLQKLTF